MPARPSRKVRPTLVVDRDGDMWAQRFAELHCVPCSHRVSDRTRDGELRAAEMQQRGADSKPPRDVPHAGVEHGVARDPKDAMLLTFPFEREPHDVADDWVAQGRPVPTGSRRDLDREPAVRGETCCLPRRKPTCLTPEPLRARHRRHDRGRCGEHRAAGVIEVVGVMVVGEQDDIDGSDTRRVDRRT